MSNKLFDFCIGNPPYQDMTLGKNKSYAPPVYHQFMSSAYEIANKVELVHPARFLFNAGSTPKSWNQEMLNDEHFKVLHYEENSSSIFPNTSIKGGIAITYRDSNKVLGPIKVFSVYPEVISICNKACGVNSLCDIIIASESYKFSEEFHSINPDIRYHDGCDPDECLSKGHDYDLKSSVFKKLKNKIFFEEIPSDNHSYIPIWGTINAVRCSLFMRQDFLNPAENFTKYKVLLPAANGSGKFGEVLSQPFVAEPYVAHTQSFISIGSFESQEEAIACLKYIKTKFARCMLSTTKVTQSNNKASWINVPLQDFTVESDIDWSKTISEIDSQLFQKYGLNQDEINFIETSVLEME